MLYGDPVLREKCIPIGEINREVKDLVAEMVATLKKAGGLGLAASQTGVAVKIFIVDLSSVDLAESIKVFINPHILETSGEVTMEEGCLSFPGIYQDIVRPERVTVKATGLDGKEFTLEATGILARAIQHENDHLAGILFIDHFPPLSRALIRGKLSKLKKTATAS